MAVAPQPQISLRASADDGGRSCLPLRDSPGFSPGSLLRCRRQAPTNQLHASPLRVSDLLWSRDSHPVSGLFGSRVAASLPRFTATRRTRSGLTVGSTLDGGPDWADGATRLGVGA